MDAVVLAGGYATRLWPITIRKPKMLLPITNDTVVFDHVLPALEDEPRIEHVYINTNRGHYRMFQKFFEDRQYEKPILSVEDTAAEAEKHGVIGGLHRLIEREGIDGDLLVIAGDNIINFDIGAFLDFQAEHGTPVLAAYDVESYSEASKYGIVETDDTRVTSFEEKPDDPTSTLASIACYYFPKEDIAKIQTYLDEGNNPDEPGWFVQWLQAKQTVHAYAFTDAWFDIGTPDSYLDAVEWANGDPSVAASATVENATLDGATLVMDNAEVKNTDLSRTVVFNNAVVSDATVANSLVGNDAFVHGLNVRDSTVGPHDTLQAYRDRRFTLGGE